MHAHWLHKYAKIAVWYACFAIDVNAKDYTTVMLNRHLAAALSFGGLLVVDATVCPFSLLFFSLPFCQDIDRQRFQKLCFEEFLFWSPCSPWIWRGAFSVSGFKGEVPRKTNFICVRVCGVEGHGKILSSQFFFVCEKDDRKESSTKSLGGMTRPKDLDEMGSQIISSESDISHPILIYLSRNNNSQAPALTAPEPEFSVIFGSKWDPLTSAWRQGGTSPKKLAELPTGVSPLQKRIWKWDFYHCSSLSRRNALIDFIRIL